MKNKLHKSWNVKAYKKFSTPLARKSYLKGASAFQDKLLGALDIFTVLTNDEVFLHKNKIYVSREDVIVLVKELYAETVKTPIKAT